MFTAPLPNKILCRIALYDDAIAYKESFLPYYSRQVQFSFSIPHLKQLIEQAVYPSFLTKWSTTPGEKIARSYFTDNLKTKLPVLPPSLSIQGKQSLYYSKQLDNNNTLAMHTTVCANTS